MFKKGFTLIEMIIVITIITIITLMATPSIFNMLGTAEQNNRTETAKTIYLTAQNQLTQMRAMGNLKGAYNGEIAGKYFAVDAQGEYTDELDETVELENNVFAMLTSANYPAEDLQNGQDNYVRYLSKPAGELPNNALHQLLAPALKDASILEGTILIEYNILTGKVLSVFYSDLDRVTEFSYTAASNSSENILGTRAESYNETARNRKQGYYGVDYTGSDAPDLAYQMAVHLYDGYDDAHDDTLLLPGISRYNKPLASVNDRALGEKYENLLYVEILVEKATLAKTPAPEFDFSISGYPDVIIDDYDISSFSDDETLEFAIEEYDSGARPAIIYRNDDPTGDPDFARFIWVLDFVGGDMSSENPDRHKYSITNIEDVYGNKQNYESATGITVSVIESNNSTALPVESNMKHPLFADNKDAINPDPLQSNIASARHLSNIRYTTNDADTAHVYSQVENIDFAVDNGHILIDGNFEDTSPDSDEDAWNFKMSPLPELYGTYTALYTVNNGGTNETGVYTIQNMNIFNVNTDTDNTSDAEVINRSVGLFEKIADTGMVSHLTFIDPLLEVKNTETADPDAGKYAGVLTGFSNGKIQHITVISNSEIAPIIDVDNDTALNGEDDTTDITSDYVGGVVGMVGASVEENSISNILYLAVAPHEDMGTTEDMTRYEYPIIGTNLKNGLTTLPTTDPDKTNFEQSGPTGYVQLAIDDDSCYYLVGELLRPYDDDPDNDPVTAPPEHTNLNVGTVTNGFGKGISTNDLYYDLNDVNSDFYKNFMLSDTGELEYSHNLTVIAPLDVDTISGDQYPYPYFGDILPNADSIDPTDPDEELNFTWPVAELKTFTADYLYYEVYGNIKDADNPEIGYYQVDSDGKEIINTLIDTDISIDYRILSDGYAVKVNRPYSMLNGDDILFSLNSVSIDATEMEEWIYAYTQNGYLNEFTNEFRAVAGSTDIESLLVFDNAKIKSAVVDDAFAETSDVMRFEITNGRISSSNVMFINPLFAHAFYVGDTSDAKSMTYTVRTARHLNNIGYHANSESADSNFTQAVSIDLSNYGKAIGRDSANWSYTSIDPSMVYLYLKHNIVPSSTASGLQVDGVVSAIEQPFGGDYNANGHTISNLEINDTDVDSALFGSTTNQSLIQNLNLNNFDITSKGLVLAATLVCENAGDIKNVAVTNSTVLATKSTENPTNVGGVVAVNTGTVENVTITNSAIERHEVESPSVTTGLLSYGVGAIIGSNGGTLKNSGALDTSVLAHDNFIGGLVGISTNNGIIEDNYFISSKESTAGNPVASISYDNSVTLAGTNPRNSIGGIVGGIVYNEVITSGGATVNDEGNVYNNLFLAVAPAVDTDGNSTFDVNYPIVGVKSDGFDIKNNIYLSGSYYSNNNSSWVAFDYNTLPLHIAANVNEILPLTSENINRNWLDVYGNGQLLNWTWASASGYPMPPNANPITATTLPYTANRPRQHNLYSGNGSVVAAGNFNANLLFGGKAANFAEPGTSTNVTLELFNTSADTVTLDKFTTLRIKLENYADYVDVSSFTGKTARISLLDNAGGLISDNVQYSFDSTSNSIIIDTSTLSATQILANEKVTFSFNINIKTEFTSTLFNRQPIPTDYYYVAMQANIVLNKGAGDVPATLNSDKLYIQKAITINNPIGAGMIPNTGTQISIPVTATINTSNLTGYTQTSVITQVFPAAFNVAANSVSMQIDGGSSVALTQGTDYLITANDNGTPSDVSDDKTELTILNLSPTSSAVLSYNLEYTGTGGVFEIANKYTWFSFKEPNSMPVAGGEFVEISNFNVQIFTRMAPAPATFSSLMPQAQSNEDSKETQNADSDSEPNEEAQSPDSNSSSSANSQDTNSNGSSSDNSLDTDSNSSSSDVSQSSSNESSSSESTDSSGGNSNDTN